MKILCCGEALIDMIPEATTSGEAGYVPFSGGSVFNTAIALGRLGVDVGMLAGISNDLFGEQLAAALSDSHVHTSCLIRSDRPTTLAFVRLRDGHATYTFYDENSAGRMIAPDELPDLPDDVQCLYFGGISLINPPAADTLLALAEREAAHRTIMLDPNIRPGFVDDEAGYRARLSRMIAVADVVKVSDDDLEWLFPDDARPEAIAGPAIVILTKGSDGAVIRRADGSEIMVDAPTANVVDTVGAGDTFNAGFLSEADTLGLLTKGAFADASSDALRQCLEHAAKVAAVTVSRAGANPPWRHEL